MYSEIDILKGPNDEVMLLGEVKKFEKFYEEIVLDDGVTGKVTEAAEETKMSEDESCVHINNFPPEKIIESQAESIIKSESRGGPMNSEIDILKGENDEVMILGEVKKCVKIYEEIVLDDGVTGKVTEATEETNMSEDESCVHINNFPPAKIIESQAESIIKSESRGGLMNSEMDILKGQNDEIILLGEVKKCDKIYEEIVLDDGVTGKVTEVTEETKMSEDESCVHINNFSPTNIIESQAESIGKSESRGGLELESYSEPIIEVESKDETIIELESKDEPIIALQSHGEPIIELESKNEVIIDLESLDESFIELESQDQSIIQLESQDEPIVELELKNEAIIELESESDCDDIEITNVILSRSHLKMAFHFAEMDNVCGLKELVKSGLDVNCRNYKKWTLLMTAAYRGSCAVVGYLLPQLVDLQAVARKLAKKQKQKCTAPEKYIKILKLFKKYSSIYQKNKRLDPNKIIQKNKKNIKGDLKKQNEKFNRDITPQLVDFYCDVCAQQFYKMNQKKHSFSIVHLSKLKNPQPYTNFHIDTNNIGYQLLLKSGWNGKSGLGKNEQGKIYPVRGGFKNDRSGLGQEYDCSQASTSAAKKFRKGNKIDNTWKKKQRKPVLSFLRSNEITKTIA